MPPANYAITPAATAVLSSALSLHVSAGYMQGRRIESPWSTTVGVNRWF
ncbi:hypothetical protein [Erwinia sp.]|nr:hypothetical protein [Erwinia sp.]